MAENANAAGPGEHTAAGTDSGGGEVAHSSTHIVVSKTPACQTQPNAQVPAETNRLLAAALAYAARGWPVFPCKPRGKEPLTPHGFKDATIDWATIRTWWARWPEANIGIPTGQRTFVVLDEDPRNGGDESLRELVAQSGPLPATPLVLTGGGGTHHWLTPPDVPLRCCKLAEGLDLKADGGYVIAPPSIHPGGWPYAWEASAHVEDVPLALMPSWLLALATAGSTARNDGRAPVLAMEQTISEGQRNNALTSLAGSMRRRGLTEAEMLPTLLAINESRCAPPLPQATVETIARSVARYAPTPEASDHPIHFTDWGNARRLVARHGRDLHYCHAWGKWLIWDGTRWTPDDTAEVERRAKDTVASIYAEAAGLADEENRKALAKWAIRSEASNKVRAMIALAGSEPGIPVRPDDLDANPWVLDTLNGTLNLRTGELRPHDPADMITHQTAVDYDPNAQAPLWQAFLTKVMDGNDDLIAFLQRAVGYSLTGDTGERALFFLYGCGANGKSTFLETIRAVAGDYGLRTPTETLLTKRDGAIPNDVARLKGARLVIAAEADEGKRLAEALVKDITGGDTISARFLRAEWFDFRPQCKIWLATNHKPTVRGTDRAIWDRIKLIPFTVTIPEDEQDKGLVEKLQAELSGILAWAVRGCLEWQERGLGIPDEVKAATNSYREEMDILGGFIADCCELAPTAQETTRELYQGYVDWCEANGEKPIRKTSFGLRLAERGFDQYRTGKTRGWVGIQLLTPGAHDEEL